ncbi:hypothetical protein DITRI_Ditri10aG0192500 [Diplodiscus trichospermus]
MLCTFIIAQTFLIILCHRRACIFLFFAGWLIVMNVAIMTMLPETNGIPIDEIFERAWMQYWFWKRCNKLAGAGDIQKSKQIQA